MKVNEQPRSVEIRVKKLKIKITCKAIPLSLQSHVASVSNSRIASRTFLKVDADANFASNMLKDNRVGQINVVENYLT
ncbi:hypothetical protein T05_7465 [Trichinella murrelli]|uniref:Uncharacterized protein n=1 Tax=Trichinella murrelli TaxID=144512 RepID=A0A0V0TTH0_9BILA|nr:hypothetical protein T05_7465 [Trichinella murrelli]